MAIVRGTGLENAMMGRIGEVVELRSKEKEVLLKRFREVCLLFLTSCGEFHGVELGERVWSS